MFSQVIQHEIGSFRDRIRLEGQMDDASSGSVLSTISCSDDLLAIILDPRLGSDETWTRRIIREASDVRRRQWNNQIFAISPLYVTSFCSEHCAYCNYRAENKSVNLQRRRLSNDELRQEVEFLIERGIRVIELVYATDPFVRIDKICGDVRLTKEALDQVGGGLVGINAEPFEAEEYRLLTDASLDFAVLWQETYDPQRYSEVHTGRTKKVDYSYRLDGIERMIRGGVPQVGMGVLSGLGDWRFDWYLLLRHIEYIQAEYGISPAILGVPRMKDAAGAALHDVSRAPSDIEFLALVNLCMLNSPSIMPFVNTREDWNTCLALSDGGGNLFTFNCSTIPGGYKLGSVGYQFPTFTYDVAEYASRAANDGFRVRLDWRFEHR